MLHGIGHTPPPRQTHLLRAVLVNFLRWLSASGLPRGHICPWNMLGTPLVDGGGGHHLLISRIFLINFSLNFQLTLLYNVADGLLPMVVLLLRLRMILACPQNGAICILGEGMLHSPGS